eukprot:scpid48236/ scgid11170/ 
MEPPVNKISTKKKPRTCQRCRTHGTEELSTATHRGNCPWKDCKCMKCEAIQKENERHALYNKRRRADRQGGIYKGPRGYVLDHANKFMPHFSPQVPDLSRYRMKPDRLIPPDPPLAMHREMVPGPPTSDYTRFIQRPPQPPPFLPHRPQHPQHPYPLPQHYREGYALASEGASRMPPGPGPMQSISPGAAHHHSPPQVKPGRPYNMGEYPPQQDSYSRPSYAAVPLVGNSRPGQHNPHHGRAADLDDPPADHTMLSEQRQRSSSLVESRDLYDVGMRHARDRSPHHRTASSSGLSPVRRAEDGRVEEHPYTSPPPLQPSQYQAEMKAAEQQAPEQVCDDLESDAHDDTPQPELPDRPASNADLPWNVNTKTSATACGLVQLLDQNPNVDHRIAFMYLTSCGGDVAKAHEALQEVSKCMSSDAYGSSASSDIEVDDVEDRYRRLTSQSRNGYRLNRPGQASERVLDRWSSSASSPERQRSVSRSPPCRKGKRRCSTCKTWFSIARANNTVFCSRHKQHANARENRR